MNARLARRLTLGVLLLAVVVALALYGTHLGVILGRIGLQVF